jgi:TolB-like protein/Tfp pilus assembly protein PilF
MGDGVSWGPFLFDPTAGTLTREGKSIPIGTRGAPLLSALIAADGASVGKDVLIERAWPGLAVEEGNLTVQIANLRKAMGPRSDGQEWIATVPRVGYRLLKAPSEAIAPSVLPSLAVLPFENLSGDRAQDYFADGIVEDLITALSRFKSFAVAARSSSFVYKGRVVDARQIGQELGVQYVLNGSVRRAGGQVRVSAQLVDAEGGAQLWAEKFDGEVGDVFDMQDSVIENVVAIVEPRVKSAEIERSRRKRPDNLDAYDLYLQALPDVYSMRPDRNARAIQLLEQAVKLDPGFAPAAAMAGIAYLARHTMQLAGANPDEDVQRAVGYARVALSSGSDDATVLANAGFLIAQLGLGYDEGFALLRRAVEENPNNAGVLTNIGIACLLAGDLAEGEAFLRRAIRLNPNEFDTHWQLTGIAHIRMAEGRYEEALEVAKRSLGVNAGYDATYWMLIAANAYLGRMADAQEAVRRLQEISPHVTLARIRRGQRSLDPHRIDVLIEGMRLAGLPEG